MAPGTHSTKRSRVRVSLGPHLPPACGRSHLPHDAESGSRERIDPAGGIKNILKKVRSVTVRMGAARSGRSC